MLYIFTIAKKIILSFLTDIFIFTVALIFGVSPRLKTLTLALYILVELGISLRVTLSPLVI
jgi:hypothetical protein